MHPVVVEHHIEAVVEKDLCVWIHGGVVAGVSVYDDGGFLGLGDIGLWGVWVHDYAS